LEIILPDLNNIQPLHLTGIVDYHCHCDYSIDAEGSVSDFCQAAVKRNLAEICFTTHYDTNPISDGNSNFINVKGKKVPATPENLKPYVDDVLQAANDFYFEGLSVKLGIEIGWYDGCEENIQKLLDRYPFDYVLCGIHELENICFCCRSSYEKCFERFTPEKAVEKYFQQVQNAARSELFDNIAHLAYYLKYGRQYYGDSLLSAHLPYIEDTFKVLVQHKAGIEINTSAIRHGLDHFYPTVEIINSAKKAGVEIMFLGSDAHKPEQVGFEFEMAASLVPDTDQSCQD